ncbi:uncharacterized protein TRIVIDRAFT_218806 [Trichoderma virens Gv29-8]|uniref:HNH nuclease domain-containing protein n=1 Tax=Hypocrea virens (strain Gv29-8 / FGSC 10586) TaxID=413071 RepID=G9MGL4_HYPVG|nr:uncharacterized protein TRIVIDRAFT_218806 [Trichoderma virens Gv29-8]EHK26661.1 hypothetical protein TRIVIDRAFT_218806 [Trichoderma virens Gv29-8]UKZ46836.1 hypothetical protein TrVGV298_001047 [Trichoderma virens]
MTIDNDPNLRGDLGAGGTRVANTLQASGETGRNYSDFEDPLAKHILTQYPSSSSSNQFLSTPNIGPLQLRDLQSDVEKILNDYSSTPTREKDDTPEVFRAFIKYLCQEARTILMQEIRQFSGKSELRQLRNFLVDSILKTMLIAGGKQPKSLTPSPIVIPGLIAEENQLTLRSHQTALKGECLKRDDHGCVITGHMEYDSYKKLPPERRRNRYTCNTECGHIIPFALRIFNPKSAQEAETKAQIWRSIYRYFPFVAEKISAENINAPENAMTLWMDAHEQFISHRLALEPTNIEHEYRVHAIEELSIVTRDLPKSIIMKQWDPEVLMPDPDFLKFHYQVSMILQESGIREKYERTVWENNNNLIDNIQPDGSTDLGNIFSNKMLTNI